MECNPPTWVVAGSSRRSVVQGQVQLRVELLETLSQKNEIKESLLFYLSGITDIARLHLSSVTVNSLIQISICSQLGDPILFERLSCPGPVPSALQSENELWMRCPSSVSALPLPGYMTLSPKRFVKVVRQIILSVTWPKTFT